jgi:hypothetical protein
MRNAKENLAICTVYGPVKLANDVLRVIVSKDEPKRVVTAYLDRKMKGQL